MTLHATAVALALDRDGPLIGVLITGVSGLGKSSLAIALIEQCPWRRTALVADDVVEVTAVGNRWVARATGPMTGQIEVRGFGPVPVRAVKAARLHFALAVQAERPPRLYTRQDMTPGQEAAMPPMANLLRVPFWAENAAIYHARVRIIARAILAGQIPS
ncbi:MAG: hypothetical protein AAFR20_01795 [Pseudomonadota bacterium]